MYKLCLFPGGSRTPASTEGVGEGGGGGRGKEEGGEREGWTGRRGRGMGRGRRGTIVHVQSTHKKHKGILDTVDECMTAAEFVASNERRKDISAKQERGQFQHFLPTKPMN